MLIAGMTLKTPEGHYTAINLRTGAHTGHITNASFLNWYAGIESPEMMAELQAAFAASPYPVPSHKVGAAEFDSKRYWRGPTWAMFNALIARGLLDMGHVEEAEALRSKTASLMAQHGFAEYFDPLTGAPAGGGTFTWTAAVWLAWASPSQGEVMGAINLDGVEKWFGEAQVIKGVNLEIEDGEFSFRPLGLWQVYLAADDWRAGGYQPGRPAHRWC